MDDVLRPSETAFKAAYERGFRTWAALWDASAGHGSSITDCLGDLYSAFPKHPCFPHDLRLVKAFTNTVVAKGSATWKTSREPCDLPPLQEEVVFQVASRSVTAVNFVPSTHPPTNRPQFTSNETTILTLAWAYVLSARWAELIPGVRAPSYTNPQGSSEEDFSNHKSRVLVDVGNVSEHAAQWWKAVLSAGSGWCADITTDTGFTLHSPWSVAIHSRTALLVASASNEHSPYMAGFSAPSFSTAMGYLSDFVSSHDAAEQSQAALAAALLIPLAKLDNRRIELSLSPAPIESPHYPERNKTPFSWDSEVSQLDRLLTLSCNSRGVKSLLSSIFFDSDVACNVCGPWLQGSFAFLDSERAKDPHLRLQTFMRRDPGLGFLWLGAFITGAEARCLQEARSGWWKVDLHTAAWTETHVSFIQGVMGNADTDSKHISRADECRLLYLSHEQDHSIPPLFPFAPFGFTALEDTDLAVRCHVHCPGSHGLFYDGFTWHCENGPKHIEENSLPDANFRLKAAPQLGQDSPAISYGELDDEDETSEMVTRNIFTWLRGENGLPVAERALREHEWLKDWDSDDGSPIEGDTHSTAGGNVGSWLLELSTTKTSNSI